jgi:hypothetical protein
MKNELIAEIVAHLAYSSIQQKNQTKLVFFFNNEKQIFQLGNMGSLLVATETLLNFDLLKTQISAETLSAYLVHF